jgi:hypothetical protein
MRRPCTTSAVLSILIGCGAATGGSRQRAIEVGLAQDARTAAELTAETMRQGRLQSLQIECLAAFECAQRREKVEALVQAFEATCHNEVARHERCQAEQAMRQAEATIFGCIFGVLFGPAGIAVGCAGANALSANDRACDGVGRAGSCAGQQRVFQVQALGRAGMSTYPVCAPQPLECSRLMAFRQ